MINEDMQLGQLLTARKSLYDRKKAIESGELAEIKQDLTDADRIISRKMQDLGLRQLQDEGGKATFYISDEIVPKINDWDQLYRYVKDNDYFHLFYRKLTATAYRELISHGEDIPGVEPEVVTRLKMRSN